MNDIEYIGNAKFVVTEDWLRETLSATLEMKNVKLMFPLQATMVWGITNGKQEANRIITKMIRKYNKTQANKESEAHDAY